MDKTLELGNRPIGKLLLKYSLPAVLAMMVNAIYNIVDRIFISNFVGEEALAGLTIAFPVMMMVFAFGGLIGIGGVSLLSIRLGEQDQRGASHVFGNTLGLATIISLVLIIVLFIFLEPLLTLFGATSDTLFYATDYLRIILFGFIFMMAAFSLNNAVRTEGRPMLAMGAMILSAGMNIVLDAVFIILMDMGVQGAAYATIIAQFSGFAVLISFYLRGKSVLKLKPRDFIPEFKLTTKILSIGFATFISTIGMSIALVFLNNALGDNGGTAAITSMGAINSLFTLFIMPIMGLQQGMQPIVGYNHGAKQPARVYRTLKLAMIVGVLFSTIVFVLLQLFPTIFMGLFIDSTSTTMPIAVEGLRIYILMLPLLAVNFLGISFYQSIAQGRMSMILGVLRQIVFLIPAILILPQFFGLSGVWFATPLSDALAIIITAIVLGVHYKKERKLIVNKVIDSKEILEV